MSEELTGENRMNELITKQDSLPEKISGSNVIAVNPMELLSMAVQHGAGMEQMERLMALQERWESNQARKAFDAAISAARAKIKPIVKSAEVDFTSPKGRTNYKHETLDGIAKSVDPILGEHGLSYRFRSRQDGSVLHVTCIIAHAGGHSEETELSGAPDISGNKNSYQAIGSAATYLQRYTLKLALGLSAAKDDDSNATGGDTDNGFEVAADWIAKIDESTNLTELKSNYTEAYGAVKDNKNAIGLINQAKDLKKKELSK